MRPYLAVIIDSFRAAMSSWVLYIMLIAITAILLVMAPVGYEEELTTSVHREELVDPLGVIDRLLQEGPKDAASPSQRIWKGLDEPLRKDLAGLTEKLVKASRSPQEADRAIAQTNTLLDKLTNKIDGMLDDEDFFDEATWGKVELDKEAHELIEKALRQLPEPDWAAAVKENGAPVKLPNTAEITYDEWKKLRLNADVKAGLLEEAKGRMSHEELGRLNRLALDSAFAGMVNPSSRTSMRFYWAVFDTGQSIPLRRQELSDILNSTMPWIVDKFVLSIGMIIAIIVTAPIVPQMFEPGSLSLLLSKPVSRWMLFLSKFVGGCAFTLLCAAYLFGGAWLLLGWRLGIWHEGVLLAIPIYVFVFAIYFTVSAIAGVIWRNSIVSVIVAVLFWAVCWLVGTVEWGLGTLSLQRYRISKLTPLGDEPPLYTDFRDAVFAWSKRDGQWREAIDDQLSRERRGFLGMNMLGPVYDEGRGQASIIRADLSGRQQLVTARRDEDWAPQQVGSAPLLSRFLFREPEGDLLVLTGLGDLQRVKGDPLDVLRRIEKAANQTGETAADKSDEGDESDRSSAVQSLAQRLNVFQPAGPSQPIAVRDPFAASMHPERPLLATFSSGVISLYARGENGEYSLERQSKRLPGNNDTTQATMACTKNHLVVARGDGKVLAVRLSDLKTEKEWTPGAAGLALSAVASNDGRHAAVLFQDYQLFLVDTEKMQLELAEVEGQGKITTAAFGERSRLWVATHEQRVTEYIVGDALKADRRIDPPLDFQQKVYYYFVKPFYTICPKPGEFYETVQYLLLDSDDSESATNTVSRALRATLNPWAPVWSGLAFIGVMLGLACLYIERQDF